MPDERFVDQEVTKALARLRSEMPAIWARLSRPLRITLPVAGATRDVVHGLGETPEGFVVVWTDAPIYAVPGLAWTRDLAYLTSAANNVHAIVLFYTLKEAPADA